MSAHFLNFNVSLTVFNICLICSLLVMKSLLPTSRHIKWHVNSVSVISHGECVYLSYLWLGALDILGLNGTVSSMRCSSPYHGDTNLPSILWE